MGMRANAHLRKRGPEPRNAAVERREARFPDRKGKRHASRVPGQSPAASRGLASPGVSRRSAPLARGSEKRKGATRLRQGYGGQASGANAPRERERLFEIRIVAMKRAPRARKNFLCAPSAPHQ